MTIESAAPHIAPETIASFLAEPLRVGQPDLAGPLAVFPLFGPEPRRPYAPFAAARAAGFRVGELRGGASVNDLEVANPTPHDVLLFEGEEVLGAQQNRTFDVTVLVGAGAKLRVPVSCVEAGRWQAARHAESLAAAPQAAYPELRRAKARRVRERLAAGAEARADQGEVWDEMRPSRSTSSCTSATPFAKPNTSQASQTGSTAWRVKTPNPPIASCGALSLKKNSPPGGSAAKRCWLGRQKLTSVSSGRA